MDGNEGEIQAERITENTVEVKINLEHGRSRKLTQIGIT